MNRICKVILAAAAVAAFAAPAMAVDKLIVNNTGGTAGFKVDDTGKVTVRNLGNTADVFTVTNDGTISTAGFYYNGATSNTGMGTISPVAALSVTATTASGSRGLVISQHNTGAQSAIGGFRKSRGTEAVPVSVNSGDYIGAFGFKNYDGTTYIQNASFGARVNGTVTTGSVPTEIFFCNNAANLTDCYGSGSVRMLIGATGNIGIGTLTPTSKLHVSGLPLYDTVATATGAGLTSGAIFRTTGNVLMIVP
jgi:hypothetical protein